MAFKPVKTERDFNKEADELIKGLSNAELYAMHEMVVNMQRRGQSKVRRLELEAVQAAVERVPGLDQDRLSAAVRGYRSSMAENARAKDGNTKVNKRKV